MGKVENEISLLILKREENTEGYKTHNRLIIKLVFKRFGFKKG
jgi:hypothetical protein